MHAAPHRAKGAIPHYAGGGLIGKLFGGGKPAETITEKFERQDRERAAKRGEKPPPAPAAPAPAPGGAMNPANALKRREEAAGLAAGGAVKRAKGAIHGPGGPTEDKVPLMGSPGEFMVRAAAVQHVGLPFMKALNKLGGPQPMAGAELPKPAARGAVKKLAVGGLVTEEDAPGRRVAPYVNHRAPTGAPAMPPPLQLPNNAPPPGTAMTAPPQSYRPNFTMGGFAQPPAADPAVTDAQPRTPRATPQWTPERASPEAKAWQASRAVGAVPPPAAAPAGPSAAYRVGAAVGRGVQAVGNNRLVRAAGALAQPLVLGSTAMSAGSTPTADYEERFGFGPGTSDSPAVNLVRDVGVRALGAASDLGNAMTGGLAGQFYRDKQRAPAASAPAPRGALPAAAAAPAAQGVAAPAMPPVEAGPFVPAANNQVVRSGNSYSGSNVSGDVQFVDPAGMPLATRTAGGGSFNVLDTSAGYASDLRQLAAGAGDGGEALMAARRGALQRGDVDGVRASYGGNFAGKTAADAPVDALMANGRPMTSRKLGAIAQYRQGQAQAENATADRVESRARGALEAQSTQMDIVAKQQLMAVQSKLAAAKTDAQREAATQELQALQGKYQREMPNKFTVVPGGQEIDPATGAAVTRPARVLDNQTGQFLDQQPGAQTSKFENGKTYVDARGNRAKWDGSKFVPA